MFAFSLLNNDLKQVIPAEFSRKYLAGKEGQATFWVREDRTWNIRFKYNAHSNRVALSTKWIKFVEENNLKEGDACVFEMIDHKQVSFKVHISPAGEKEPRLEQLQGYS